MVVAGTSAACGWWWPIGAVHGLVVVSLPATDGWKDCADTAPIVDTSAITTRIFELIISVSKCIPPHKCGSDIQICAEDPLFPIIAYA